MLLLLVTIGVCSLWTLLKHLHMVSWMFPCFVIRRLGLSVLLEQFLVSITVSMACFKGVATDFMLSEGFTAVNDSQTVWNKSQGRSFLINAWFVDDVHHCTNDLCMCRSFR
jgi:hypothetical protein